MVRTYPIVNCSEVRILILILNLKYAIRINQLCWAIDGQQFQ